MSSTEEFKQILKEAWGASSIIIKTPDYVYVLKKEGENWVEASYLLSDKDLQKRVLTSDKALMYLIEEVTKSLPQYNPQIKSNVIVEKTDLDEIINSI